MSAAMRRVVGVGAGGHARVVLDMLRFDPTLQVIGVTDADPARRGQFLAGCPILGGDDLLPGLREQGVEAAFIGVGSIAPGPHRQRLFESLRAQGFTVLSITHPRAVVAPGVQVAAGVTIMAGAILNPGVELGCNVIINTGAIVEHDTRIGDHAHVAPGAVLGGDVVVETGAHVGLGACVRQGVRIGAHALVAAGAVVVRDVPPHARVMGVPARTGQRSQVVQHD